MHLSTVRVFALLALIVVPVAARADAMSDQKKAYQLLGAKVPHPPAMCNLLTKSEASHYLGKPVSDGVSAGAAAGCAYRATDGSNDGILVIRESRSAWFAPTSDSKYRAVSGVGEKAYTAYEPGLGYEAGVLAPNGVTNIQISGTASADAALALARIAMKR